MARRFTFEDVDGDVAVLDRGQRICRVSRQFKSLVEVRFKPAGEFLFGGRGNRGLSLAWQRPNCREHAPDRMQVGTQLTRTGAARLTVQCSDGSGVLGHETQIDISWSPRWHSYVYQFQTRVSVGEGGDWRTFDDGWYDGMEYLDLYPAGVFNEGWSRPEPWDNPNPIQMRPWGAKERYRACLYQDASGQWRKFPLNHLVGRWCNRLKLGGDGLFAFVNEPAGNPVVQLLGSTRRDSMVSICHHMYDVHFVLPGPMWVPQGAQASAGYRLFSVDEQTASSWQRKAQPMEVNDWDRWRLGLPAYEPPGKISTFDRAIRLDGYDSAFHWMPTNAAGWYGYEIPIDREDVKFTWSPRQGRDGKGAVAVWACQGGTWGWVSTMHPQQVKPNTRYSLSAWIKTRDLRGRGATVGITGTMPIGRKTYRNHENVLYCPRRIKGTSDWVRIEFNLPKFADNSGTDRNGYFYRHNVVQIWLIQDGTGTTWFDDVLLSPVKE
ncbi:MAG: hypothetical protein HQ546_08315 [Planctomycetes bacterium]|nr:hypothetical protein [Planctomycetota bacterium]